MEEKLTDELLRELLEAPTLPSFLETHEFPGYALSGYLQLLLEEHGLDRSTVIKEANLNPTFGYQIFTGSRQASRNKVLQLIFAMGLSLDEANHLLQAAKANELFCKDRRDAIIIFCITHSLNLLKANELLYDFGEDTIC